MQVSIKFDTEKESVEELQKLVASLQDLIERKQKVQIPQSSPTPQPTQPQPVQAQSTQTQPAQSAPASGRTSGGAQIVDYDPEMEKRFSNIFSGKGGTI